MVLLRQTERDYDNLEAWEGDVLGRNEVAKMLTKVIASLRSSFVLSLEGSYGEGKTYFLRNWQKDLQEDGYITAYFNSWTSDHLEDPVMPFMACMTEALQTYRASLPDRETEDFIDAAASFAGKIVTKGAPLIAKGLARYALGDSGLEELKDLTDSKTEQDIVNLVGKTIADGLNDYHEAQRGLEAFKEGLQAAIEEQTTQNEEDKKKIIILVDELDRCKPTYAVKVLERIKHFFDVDGLVFVLGINERQVANAMAAVYGNKLNTEEYLRRFIHWRFALPAPNSEQFASLMIEKFNLKTYMRNFDKSEVFSRNKYGFEVVFALGASALNLTLRQQETAFIAINLYLRTKFEKNHSMMALAFLMPLWLMRNEYLEDDSPNKEKISFHVNKAISDGLLSDKPKGASELCDILFSLYERNTGLNRQHHNTANLKALIIRCFVGPQGGLGKNENGGIGKSNNENSKESSFFAKLFQGGNDEAFQNQKSAASEVWSGLEENSKLLIEQIIYK